jgi:hypothetical protein
LVSDAKSDSITGRALLAFRLDPGALREGCIDLSFDAIRIEFVMFVLKKDCGFITCDWIVVGICFHPLALRWLVVILFVYLNGRDWETFKGNTVIMAIASYDLIIAAEAIIVIQDNLEILRENDGPNAVWDDVVSLHISLRQFK